MKYDPAPALLASRLRVGKLRATGVPAILIGVAGIILAAGVSRSLGSIAPTLPETLREFKTLFDAGGQPRPLNS